MSSHLAHLTANQRVGLVAAVMRTTGLSWDDACRVTEDALDLHLEVYAMRLAETVAGCTGRYSEEAKRYMKSVVNFAAEDAAADTDLSNQVEAETETESATPTREGVDHRHAVSP